VADLFRNLLDSELLLLDRNLPVFLDLDLLLDLVLLLALILFS